MNLHISSCLIYLGSHSQDPDGSHIIWTEAFLRLWSPYLYHPQSVDWVGSTTVDPSL